MELRPILFLQEQIKDIIIKGELRFIRYIHIYRSQNFSGAAWGCFEEKDFVVMPLNVERIEGGREKREGGRERER